MELSCVQMKIVKLPLDMNTKRGEEVDVRCSGRSVNAVLLLFEG